jgi:hypothetical protein
VHGSPGYVFGAVAGILRTVAVNLFLAERLRPRPSRHRRRCRELASFAGSVVRPCLLILPRRGPVSIADVTALRSLGFRSADFIKEARLGTARSNLLCGRRVLHAP